MFDVSFSFLLAVAATFFVAGLVKGVTGMGLPTVAMGALGALISPAAAASLLVVPSFVTNVWQLLAGSAILPLVRRFWPMMLAIVAGTLFGSAWLAGGDTRLTTAALGATLVIYSGCALLAPPFRISGRQERWLAPIVGTLTGLVTGCTGVFVIPAVPYLQALGLAKDDLVQVLGLSFTVSTIALAVGLGAQGTFRAETLALSGVAVVPALAGMWAGQRLRSRVSAQGFRRGFLACLFLLGMEMALRPVF
ncbi:sulfite exporter TauE/SafE family protein [Ensifer adhaerens]|uniref:sulfite exporter TauE/SafE family protein n=1 Tax=Ensifer adhaerens TaxID=106592 RepID=UPI001CBC30AD|nr:sulfite exporter TauE/SafE family protein [Ensifer adhaerens]MBZ7924524.1 sulfite exporter TauE/SafE family protein [Ensifer adhaerens]UAX96236.1 sulfite exporter TauE/SafE family protein [Ensifer adhaerens]UAY04421.1 sulfite exporter TauE/SafE family protein [Ensifer adhaerens]UAY09853.1 sulfite exporter TauE/SafE family protein [Ensifer adhaerens]